MPNFDTDLGDRVKRLADRPVEDTQIPASVIAKARNRQRARAFGTLVASCGMIIGLILILASLLPLAGADKTGGPAAGSTSSSGGTPATTQTSVSNIGVTYPSDWFIRDGSSLALVSPSVDFIVGSWDFPSGGDCGPSDAVASLPRDGVLLWMIEYASPDHPAHFEPRPETFDLGPLKGPIECVGDSAYIILFKDGGRYFQAMVVLGPDAGPQGKKDAEQILGSLVIPGSA